MSWGVANDGKRVELTPTFKWLLIVVVGLTVICLVMSAVLASTNPHPTQAMNSVIDDTNFGFKAGFGAILGLFGGKAA